jgi:filamentous hemagglutinin
MFAIPSLEEVERAVSPADRGVKENMSVPRLCAKILSLVWLLLLLPTAPAQNKTDRNFGRPQIDAVKGEVKVLTDVEIIDFGKVIYKGRLDLNPTLKRIRDGKATRHRNDGAIFQNREGKLPRKDRDYYREFVVEKKGLPFPGPQRVIIGKKGEVYFTGDHYKTYTRVR